MAAKFRLANLSPVSYFVCISEILFIFLGENVADISFDLAKCRQNFGESSAIFYQNNRRIFAKFVFITFRTVV